MKRLMLVLAILASLCFAAAATAHVLKVSRAHNNSHALARYVCDSDPLPGADCTGSGVDRCQRLSAHKVRCHSYNDYVVTRSGPELGATLHCSWWDMWSILNGSSKLHWSQNVFNQTLDCKETPAPPAAP
jgi:hypothetical protein